MNRRIYVTAMNEFKCDVNKLCCERVLVGKIVNADVGRCGQPEVKDAGDSSR